MKSVLRSAVCGALGLSLLLVVRDDVSAAVGKERAVHVRLDSEHQSLVAQQGTHRWVVRLEDHVHASGLEDFEIIFETHTASNTYVLLYASGTSTGAVSNAMCGAGTESDLIVVTLDQSLQPTHVASQWIESCYEDRDIVQALLTENGRLLVGYETPEGLICVSYDHAHPETGLVGRSQPGWWLGSCW